MHRWSRRVVEGLCLIVIVAVGAHLLTGRPSTPGSFTGTPASASARTPVVLADLFVPGTAWIDTTDRDAVLAAHRSEYEEAPPVLAWAGDLDRCAEGVTTTAYRAATLQRVNHYRAMAGVPAVIEEDPLLSAKAQEAALMMSAEGALTHHPGDDYACFSTVGQEAAGNSNLYLGRTGPVAIDGYIEDPGEHNNDVGHRNTILHPPTRAMGVGDIGATEAGHAANALWVFDEHVFDENAGSGRQPLREPSRFVAWPPRGYVHADHVYPRWSVMLAGADFRSAEVMVFDLAAGPDEDGRVPLTVVNRSGSAGHVPLPTLVWEPEVELDTSVDHAYYVVITGIAPLPSDEGVSLAASSGTIPGAIAYTVTVLGDEPGRAVALEQVLAGVERTG
ncbi:MAG: CAP domain-containing protein [Actinomycetota bacterium]